MVPGFPMMEDEIDDDVCWVYMTASNRGEAKKVGRALLEAKLVACVNILDNATSMYWWEGKIQEESETVMIAKTTATCLPILIESVKANHSYQCPCVIALPVQAGNTDFLAWIREESNMAG